MTLRATLDTNVYLSGIIFGGKPGELLLHASDGLFVPLVSAAILLELERKLLHRFHRAQSTINADLRRIAEIAEFISPTFTLSAVPRDPDDNRILECAVAGSADFIVTGDNDLLVLGSFDNIPILTVRQFLDLQLG